MIEKINMNLFKDKEEFKVYYNEGEFINLEIYKIKKSRYPNPFESVRESFSLILKGPKTVLFNQGYYDFEHVNMGMVELFMVPILGAIGDHDSYYYEISFS